MSSENILTANLLDILFQNRNKEYGAYTLRKNYPRHLYMSLAIMFSAVTILSAWSFFDRSVATGDKVAIDIPVIDIALVAPPKVVELPKQSFATKVASVSNGNPVISKEEAKTEVPLNEQLDNKLIGLIDHDGDPAIGDGPVAAASEGKAEVAVKAEPSPEAKDEVLVTADVMPEFPGGIEALKRFLSRNLRNPEDQMSPGNSVRVVARFVVDKDGTISQVIFKEAGGIKFEQEVMRVLKKMPKWKPGVFRGKPAAVYFMLPVVFQMTEE
ncbi:MAG: energy transducer TonB [Chitinophagaceae bacterium]